MSEAIASMAAERFVIPDIQQALSERAFPSVTVWNRVEGRPRAVEFGRSLKAEVRDALWMLTRQWQLGEFRGDDAGSPVTARYHLTTTQLTRFDPGGPGPAADFDQTQPLETTVETRAVAFDIAGDPMFLDLRLAMGRRWLKLVSPALRPAFIDAYGIGLPDPSTAADAELVAHPLVWAAFQAAAGRAMDGYRLYDHLTASPTHHAYDGMAVADPDKPALDAAAARFVAWFDGLVLRPGPGSSWDPTRLEHNFAVSAPLGAEEKTLVAEGFGGGHLDWPAFSVSPRASLGAAGTHPELQGTITRTVLPGAVRFEGMPNTRWWAFEDGRTNLGDLKPDTTDLAKLLFGEFALVYGNDWFLLPCDLPAGTVATVRGVMVTNVFGERLWVTAAGSGADDDWQRWSMYTLDIIGTDPHTAADTSLLLLPAVSQCGEGPPVEDVLLIRDEMANMVWGVEKTVPLATGSGQRGAETAAETLAHHRRLVAAGPPGPHPPPAAPIAYQVMNSVPENWIPFIAVHVPDDNREIQLQRAGLPRLIEGDPHPPVKVAARTSLLRPGLDRHPAQPYFIHEEEVPRAGTRVSVGFRRARWRGGRVLVWLAARRQTGRGEGSSGLAFDSLVGTRRPTLKI